MNLDSFFMKLAAFIKAALRILCIVIGVFGILFVIRNLVNAMFLYNYGNGTYSTISEYTMTSLPFDENYVIYYNLGNAEYQKGNYDKAVSYYMQALNEKLPEHIAGAPASAETPPDNTGSSAAPGATSADNTETSAAPGATSPVNDIECKIRLNLALSMCHTIDFDHLDTTDEEAVMQAVTVLVQARYVLTEEGCASEPVGSNDGHYHNADKLKHDIDKMLQKLMPPSGSDSDGQGGGGGGDGNDDSQNQDDGQGDDQSDSRDQNDKSDSDQSQSQKKDQDELEQERARQESLKEDLKQQKEDLKTGSESPSSYDYEYLEGGDAQGYGDGTLW